MSGHWYCCNVPRRYPFQENDMEPGFMSRYLVHAEQKKAAKDKDACSSVTQYKLDNFLGKGGREYVSVTVDRCQLRILHSAFCILYFVFCIGSCMCI